MPKATLTFNLPEEEAEFANAVRGTDVMSILADFTQHMRTIRKHWDLSGKSAAWLFQEIDSVWEETLDDLDPYKEGF